VEQLESLRGVNRWWYGVSRGFEFRRTLGELHDGRHWLHSGCDDNLDVNRWSVTECSAACASYWLPKRSNRRDESYLYAGWYTWTVTPGHCNFSCTYQWYVWSHDDNTYTYYGNSISQDFYIAGSYFPYSFDVIVDITSAGETKTISQNFVTNETRTCGEPGQPDC